MARGKVPGKAAAIKRLIGKVFVEVRSDIGQLKGKTRGYVDDEKAAAISQRSDVANGGPPWRYAVRLPPLGVPVHAAPPIHVFYHVSYHVPYHVPHHVSYHVSYHVSFHVPMMTYARLLS